MLFGKRHVPHAFLWGGPPGPRRAPSPGLVGYQQGPYRPARGPAAGVGARPTKVCGIRLPAATWILSLAVAVPCWGLLAETVHTLPPLTYAERRPGAAGMHRPVKLSGRPGQQAIRSPGAIGLRVHFTRFSVGGGRVWVHDGRRHSSQKHGPYTSGGLFGDGDFWSDVLYGDTVVVEYQPDGVGAFHILEISHLWDRAILGPEPLTLAQVRRIHIPSMTGGLDKYLAPELRAFTIVSDPAQADAIWTEAPGTVELVAAGTGHPLWSAALPPRPTRAAARRLVRELMAAFQKR